MSSLLNRVENMAQNYMGNNNNNNSANNNNQNQDPGTYQHQNQNHNQMENQNQAVNPALSGAGNSSGGSSRYNQIFKDAKQLYNDFSNPGMNANSTATQSGAGTGTGTGSTGLATGSGSNSSNIVGGPNDALPTGSEPMGGNGMAAGSSSSQGFNKQTRDNDSMPRVSGGGNDIPSGPAGTTAGGPPGGAGAGGA